MKQQEILQPILRFPEFGVDWRELKLGSIVKINSGQTPSNFNLNNTGKYPFIKVEELNNCSKYQLKSRFYTNDDKSTIGINELIFPKRGAAILNNKIRVSKVSLIMDTNLMSLKFNGEHFYEFYYYLLLKEGLYKIADTSTIPQINNKHIEPYRLKVPSLPEQQKIADYLSTIDTKINLLEEKKEELGRYKKAMMQKLFSQEIRFKDDNGNDFPEWGNSFGGDIFISHTNKNHNSDLDVLAITQEHGAIPRNLIDYKVQVSNESVNNYKVVEKDDFIISLRSFQGGIEHSNYIGICSPAYIILRNIKPIEPLFYKAFFKSRNYINYLNRTLEGIRDGKMISYSNFAKSKLPYPSLLEQQKIANFLSAIDESIEKVTEQISQNQSFKKAMLQQMFV